MLTYSRNDRVDYLAAVIAEDARNIALASSVAGDGREVLGKCVIVDAFLPQGAQQSFWVGANKGATVEACIEGVGK